MNATNTVRTGPPFGLYAMLAAIAAGLLAGLWIGLWAGTKGAYQPDSHAMGTWLRNITNPAAAVPDTVTITAPLAYSTAATGTLAVWTIVVVAARKWMRNRTTRQRGLATAKDNAAMRSPAIRRRSTTLRPNSASIRSTNDVGVFLGQESKNDRLWATIEDTFAVIGPPRSGKTARFIAPTVERWPGPAIVTGLRPDIIDWTQHRANVGDRWLFDPADVATNDVTRLQWSPLTGCDDDVTALSRATALLAGQGEPAGNEVFWRNEGRKVLTCYLLAATHGGYKMTDVLKWAAVESSPTPVDVLNARGLDNWAAMLDNAAGQDPKYRAGVWGQVSQALFPFNLATVRRVCDHPAGVGFDPQQFATASTDTLYLLGNPREQKAVAGVNIALIDACTEQARSRARHIGRLDPPLLVALDELANVAPLHSIDELLSTGGGSGICTIAVFQSVGQARHAFGVEKGDAIVRDLATIKILFGGLGNSKDLRELGELLGERDEETTSVASRSRPGSAWWGGDVSRSMRLRPVLSPAELRELGREHPGEALVIPRTGKATKVRMPAIWEHTPTKITN